MRALRERSRLAALVVIGLFFLATAAFIVGSALAGDPGPRTPPEVQRKVDRLERRVRTLQERNGALARRAGRAEAARARQARRGARRVRRLRAAAARERRLRAALRRARR